MRVTAMSLTVAVFLSILMAPADALEREVPPVEPQPEAIEIVVTASRSPIPKGEETATLTVVSGEEIEAQGAAELHEVVRNTPGLVVNRVGGPGEQTNLFMRAGESDHTLIMIDGHQINRDGGAFEWKNMANHGVGRVEVMRGTGSALYGSDALVGAVNIITARPDGPAQLKATFEAGTYQTLRATLSASGGGDDSYYTVSSAHFAQKGYKVDETDYENTTLWGSFGMGLGERGELRLTVRSEDSEREWGSTAGAPATNTPDPNAENNRRAELFGIDIRRDMSESWKTHLKLTRYDSAETYANDPDADDDTFSRDDIQFDRTVVNWQNDVQLLRGPFGGIDAVIGFEYDREGLKTKGDFVKPSWFADDHNSGSTTRASRAGYIQLREELWGWMRLQANYRHENHDTLGSEDSYRFAAAGIFEETGTRVHLSGGRAFKEPSIFETDGLLTSSAFGTTTGNPDLDAEGCEGYDAGIEQTLLDGKLTIGSTYFNNRYTNYIVYVGTFPNYTFDNAGRVRSQGFESFINYQVTPELQLNVNYTHNNHRATKSDDSSISFLEGDPLVRRPKVIMNMTVAYKPVPKLGLFVEWSHVGNRDDIDWSAFERARLDNYDRVDMALSYQVNKALRIFGRYENIGHVHYEEAFGFEAPGSSFLGGLEWSGNF